METKKLLAALLVAAGSLALSGCPVVLVGAGVAGGYAISEDSVKSHFDLSQGRVFDRSLKVLKEMGQVTEQDEKNGLIKGKVKDVDVTVTVQPVTKKTVELEVKARNKFKMPAVDVAQEVYNKIDERLKKGWLF